MPLMGLIFTAMIFSVIAGALVSLIPQLGLHTWSFIVFVVCEYAGAAGFSMVYTPLAAAGGGSARSR